METITLPQIERIIDKRVEEKYILPLREDFSELKGLVFELAEAQKRTEKKVEELAEAQKRTEKKVEELAEAQKKTEKKVEELAEAQKRTEIEIQKLTKAINSTREELGKAIASTRKEVGGLSRSVAYSLENEAYKSLPNYLKENFAIEITKRFVRTTIEGEEINIFAIGKKDDIPIVIVGEAELRLNSIRKFKQLEKKVLSVRKKHKEDIVKILITHYALPHVIKKAKEMDIIIVQSFEW